MTFSQMFTEQHLNLIELSTWWLLYKVTGELDLTEL